VKKSVLIKNNPPMERNNSLGENIFPGTSVKNSKKPSLIIEKLISFQRTIQHFGGGGRKGNKGGVSLL